MSNNSESNNNNDILENERQPSYIVLYKNKDAPVFMAPFNQENKSQNENNLSKNDDSIIAHKEKILFSRTKFSNPKSMIEEDFYKGGNNSTKNNFSYKKTFRIKRNIHNYSGILGNCSISNNNITSKPDISSNRTGNLTSHNISSNNSKNLGLTINYSSANVNNNHSKNQKILKGYDSNNSKNNLFSINNKENNKKNMLFQSLLKFGLNGLPEKVRKSAIPIKTVGLDNRSKNSLSITIKSPNSHARKNSQNAGTDKIFTAPMKENNISSNILIQGYTE